MPEENDPMDKLIKDIINNYDGDDLLSKQQVKSVVKSDPSSLEDLSKIILSKVDGNDKIAKEIYDLFYGPLALDKDRSTSSKEALLRSLELRVESSKVLTELAKAIAKKEDGVNKGNVGVFINTKSGEDFGIDIKNIQNSEE